MRGMGKDDRDIALENCLWQWFGREESLLGPFFEELWMWKAKDDGR